MNDDAIMKRMRQSNCLVTEGMAIMKDVKNLDEDRRDEIWNLIATYIFIKEENELEHFELLEPSPYGLPFERNWALKLFHKFKWG